MSDHFTEKFIGSITHVPGDPTFSILKSHLLLEETLRAYLDKVLPHPEALSGARLTFAQVLAVARATAPNVQPDYWMWKAISDLNKLRNLLAHHLTASTLVEKTDEYVQFVVTSLNKPLPTRRTRAARQEDLTPDNEPRYIAFDMATIGLYGVVLARLGLAKPRDYS